MRGKAQLKYNILQQMDGTSPITEEIGRQMLTFGRRMSLAETFARIDSIETADVQRVADAIIWDQEVAFAGVGPGLKYVGDINALRRGTYWHNACRSRAQTGAGPLLVPEGLPRVGPGNAKPSGAASRAYAEADCNLWRVQEPPLRSELRTLRDATPQLSDRLFASTRYW